jgi:hypothetical protein
MRPLHRIPANAQPIETAMNLPKTRLVPFLCSCVLIVFIILQGETSVAGPTLTWNAFLGSADYDIGLGLASDGARNVYVAGTSHSTWGSPVRAHSGGDDGFVAKLNSITGNLLWNTFLGSGQRDQAVGIASDASGNLVVVGRSKAT